MNQYLFIIKQLLKKDTLGRAVLNYRIKKERLNGDTLDLGSAEGINHDRNEGYDKLISRTPDSQ